MSMQIALLVESLGAVRVRADEGFLPGVDPHVRFQVEVKGEPLVAQVTLVRFLTLKTKVRRNSGNLPCAPTYAFSVWRCPRISCRTRRGCTGTICRHGPCCASSERRGRGKFCRTIPGDTGKSWAADVRSGRWAFGPPFREDASSEA
jgi:hypothetical protein